MNIIRKISDKEILGALITHHGKIGAVARDLNMSSPTIRARIKRNPRLVEEYETYMDELVDEAVDALRTEIQNGNTRLIEFALDRLGKHRGFEKQTAKTDITVKGDPNNPITIEKSINMEGLSLTEKVTLMKAAKRKMTEEAEELRMELPEAPIDAEIIEDDDD